MIKKQTYIDSQLLGYVSTDHDSTIELASLRTASYLCTELCNDHAVLPPQLYRKCCSYLLEVTDENICICPSSPAYGCCGVSPLSQGGLRWSYCPADLGCPSSPAYGCCGVSPLSQGNLRWMHCPADLAPHPQPMVAVESVLLGILSLVTGWSSLDVLPLVPSPTVT